MHRSAGSTKSSFQSSNTFSSKICTTLSPKHSLSGIYGDDKTPKFIMNYPTDIDKKSILSPPLGIFFQFNFEIPLGYIEIDRMMSYDNQDIEVDGIQNYNGQWDEERGEHMEALTVMEGMLWMTLSITQ